MKATTNATTNTPVLATATCPPSSCVRFFLGIASIYDNITYGLEKGEFTEEDVYTAAKQACAHDFIAEFAGEIYPRSAKEVRVPMAVMGVIMVVAVMDL